MARLAFVLLAMCCSTLARGEDQSILMLDTGGHVAQIYNVAFTHDGNYVVSASQDKVVRIWDWRLKKTVRTIRGQVGPGQEGMIFAMALSPDGRWLAIAGRMGPITGGKVREDEDAFKIRLYDFASGELKALLRGHTDDVNSLAFSPDSKQLISGSNDKTSIIWDVASRRPVRSLFGHEGYVFSVGFSPDGTRAVTASFDKTLRLWNAADGSLIAEMRGHLHAVRALTVSPGDGTIASLDTANEIRLWDGETGQFRHILSQQTSTEDGTLVGSLSYSPDGQLLLVACSEGCQFKPRVFDTASGKELIVYSEHDNAVHASAFSPDGRTVATAGSKDFEIRIWDPLTGDTKANLKGIGRPVGAVGFASDGRQIAWRQASDSVEMALRLPNAGEAIEEPRRLTNPQGFIRAQAKQGAYSLRLGADGALEIVRNDQVQARIVRDISNGGGHSAYTLSPDGQTVVSGGDGVLAAYRLDGTTIGYFFGHESVVLSVAISPDGRYLVSGGGDQTVRLWDVKTRALLVTLFYGSDGEWVMWTPEGFFTRSEKGGEIVGWQINHGPEKAADYVSGDQVRDAFFRPDLVAAKFAGDPEGKVKAAAQTLKIEDVLKSGLAPEVTIIKTEVREDSVTELGVSRAVVKVDVTARILDRGGGIGRISWRINDTVIQSVNSTDVLNTNGEVARSFELAYPDNTLVVTAENESGRIESKSQSVEVRADERAIKGVPNLYILAVGVNGYHDVRFKLQYAIPDAETLSTALADAGVGYYRSKPQVIMLSDEGVTAEKLGAIFTELGRKIRATDVFLFFIAGHGATIKGDYYFLPSNVSAFDEDTILVQGIGKSQWRDWFAKIAAQKSILIFDTCESGSVAQVFAGLSPNARAGKAEFDAGQQRLKEATGRSLFTASSDEQSAMEGFRNHGLLTYAILEGLAKAGGDKPLIWLTDLKDYVEEEVRTYSKEMKSCSVIRQQEYCQQPKVLLGEHNYPIVPRYGKILGMLGAQGPAYSRIPTHVVIASADLMEGAARGTHAKTRLPPGTTVTLIKSEGEYAYVAKDGKALGYILLSQLAKLN